MVPALLQYSDYGLLALRVALGVILASHGWPKLRHVAAAADMLRDMGIRPARVWAIVVGLIEFVGGIFLIGGLFTQVVGLLLSAEFLFIVAKKRFGGAESGRNLRSYEFELLILGVALAIATIGAGSISLDDTFRILLY